MTYPTILKRSAKVLAEVSDERLRQDVRWGQQDHPNGTGQDEALAASRDLARAECDWRFAAGAGTWALILQEEWFEALAEEDPALLRAELIQVAAVAVAWVESIDRAAS